MRVSHNIMLVSGYLIAIVIANLAVTRWGTVAIMPVSFLLIGLDLTARDGLHELWYDGLRRKMVLLIASGSILSYLLNRSSAQIALASFVAFVLAGCADTIVYTLLRKIGRLTAINGSNVVAALVDSIAFPTLAFGGFLPLIMLGQFLAKTIGGALWSMILIRLRC